jgi:hypothetical protein
MKTLVFVSGMALMGAIAVAVKNDLLQYVYLITSAVVFSAAAVGGLLHYFKEENVDFREVYREKYLMQKEQIEKLKKVIEQQKQYTS